MKIILYIYLLVWCGLIIAAWDLNHLQAIAVGLGIGLIIGVVYAMGEE